MCNHFKLYISPANDNSTIFDTIAGNDSFVESEITTAASTPFTGIDSTGNSKRLILFVGNMLSFIFTDNQGEGSTEVDIFPGEIAPQDDSAIVSF